MHSIGYVLKLDNFEYHERELYIDYGIILISLTFSTY